MSCSICRKLCRRKHLNEDDLMETNLSRCLTTCDLTLLGIGSTLGVGVYVLAGQVAKSQAGPGVILSFVIAAVASVLAGLCYAEFGTRIPKAGSAYVYTYVTLGELWAFIIGWNLLLEYVIGTASVARTFSGYFDNLIGNPLVPWFTKTLPLSAPGLAPYIDPLSLGIVLVLSAILALGVKESANVHNLFTILNLTVLTIVICNGFAKDKIANWSLPKTQVPNSTVENCSSISTQLLMSEVGCCTNRDGCGNGGFAPYGLKGIIEGAATCFYGEETRRPGRSIPIAIISTLIAATVFYSGISLTITMMVPYYSLDWHAPVSAIFQQVGWTKMKYFVSIGAICALCTSLLGMMFPLPRIIFSMARDGIIFRFFSYVNERFKTPVYATIVGGFLAGFMAALFDVKALIQMLSIGTLLAYIIVSACVLVLRYETSNHGMINRGPVSSSFGTFRTDEATGTDEIELSQSSNCNLTFRQNALKLFQPENTVTTFSSKAVKVLVTALAVDMICLGGLLTLVLTIQISLWHVFLIIAFLFLAIGILYVISRQPQNSNHSAFMVPLVPWFPALSILSNIYLMFNLDALTWIRFAVWMVLGFLIYFFYGFKHSAESETYERRGLSLSEDESGIIELS